MALAVSQDDLSPEPPELLTRSPLALSRRTHGGGHDLGLNEARRTQVGPPQGPLSPGPCTQVGQQPSPLPQASCVGSQASPTVSTPRVQRWFTQLQPPGGPVHATTQTAVDLVTGSDGARQLPQQPSPARNTQSASWLQTPNTAPSGSDRAASAAASRLTCPVPVLAPASESAALPESRDVIAPASWCGLITVATLLQRLAVQPYPVPRPRQSASTEQVTSQVGSAAHCVADAAVGGWHAAAFATP